MRYRDIVHKVGSLYADRIINVDHVHDAIVTMSESFDKSVEQVRTDVYDLATALENDDALGCDWCGKHVENGSGYYVDDDRICNQCMLLAEST